jgi:hypothetical protein
MEGSFTTSVICPVFIGRKPERDALYRLIDQSRSGPGQVALVCGDAGIGKSRMVAEAKDYAAKQDFLLLQGNCFQVDCSYPYAPLIDLLRVYATPTTLASDLGSFARIRATRWGKGVGTVRTTRSYRPFYTRTLRSSSPPRGTAFTSLSPARAGL